MKYKGNIIKSTDIVCDTCQSNEFYSDSIIHSLVCIYCGTQSQEYLLQDNNIDDDDDDDNAQLYGIGTRNLRSQRNLKAPKIIIPRNDSKINIDENPIDVLKNFPIIELLQMYQYCLQYLLEQTLVICDIREENICINYRTTLHNIWLKYIKSWNESSSLCSIHMRYSLLFITIPYMKTIYIALILGYIILLIYMQY